MSFALFSRNFYLLAAWLLGHAEANKCPADLQSSELQTEADLMNLIQWGQHSAFESIVLNRGSTQGGGEQCVAPPSLRPNSNFGGTTCISGRWAVVGAPCSSGCAGSISFYRLNMAGSWELAETLSASPPANGDFFGGSCSMDGHKALIGTNPIVVEGSATPIAGGAVYLFELHKEKWRQVHKFIPAAAAPISFGFAVGISGSFATIAAPTSSNSLGAVYVYTHTKQPDTWALDEIIQPPPGAPLGFGYYVSISGPIVCIGAQNLSGTGAAYIYERDPSNGWVGQELPLPSTLHSFPAFNPNSNQFGCTTAVFDNSLGPDIAVVADCIGNNGIGAAWVYLRQDQTWTLAPFPLLPSAGRGHAGDQFGWLLGISGTNIVVSAHPSSWPGYAEVFKLAGSNFTSVRQLQLSDGFAGDGFGFWAGISGSYVVVGAPVPYQNRGTACFYKL